MKALPLLKLLLLVVLAAWMHILAAPVHGYAEILADSAGAEAARTAKSLGGPETSSVVLIGAVGLMLMLRRRRLQA